MPPILVTGDNPRIAAIIAAQLGIEDVRAGVLPEDKAAIVREFQTGGARVAMVGDGINDAPALMQADVGVAVGGGTDIAVESANVIVVRDDLGAVLVAGDLSRSAYRRTGHNVALAFTFNGVGIPLASTGLVQRVWAMVAMALSVTAIFVNSIGVRPGAIRADQNPPYPLVTLHLQSARSLGRLELSQVQVSQAGRALSRSSAPCHPDPHETPRLA